ncbi:MAG: tRNA (N(6)-L-threonylcarbamoyladenosine(37)-C(2))-methylthiotransferase MtaB [Fibrobacterota bacterium]
MKTRLPIGEMSMVSVSCGGKKFAIKSIGCRTNQEEMVTLRIQLEKNGYAFTDWVHDADYIIVNSCAVTASTESKTRRLLSALSSSAPQAKILITGCLAQQKPSELKSLRNVHWVVGNTFKNDIVSIIAHDDGVFHDSFKGTISSLDLDTSEVASPLDENGKTRFPLKIQEGCNFRCSYCIVPSLRGPSRSVSFASVLELCKNAVVAGYKELVFTGTHIGQFGEGDFRLERLLSEICCLDGDFRVRLSSLDPRDVSDALLDLIITNERICDHLHISFQSMSPKVLGLMKRPYENLTVMIQRLKDFRRALPFAGIGADFIVGHPGETDTDFQESVDTIRQIEFSYAHIFRYSMRPGTDAAVMSNQVVESVKTSRSAILQTVIDESRNSFLKKIDGITKKIIVESENPVRGLTSNYIHVEIPLCKASRNEWLTVRLKPLTQGRYCLAEPVR